MANRYDLIAKVSKKDDSCAPTFTKNGYNARLFLLLAGSDSVSIIEFTMH
jgi:hypothetical protein